MRPFSPRALSAGYEGPGSVLVSPVPHQMLPYMNVGTLSRTELQLLNQLHCRRKRRHRTIFTDEQLEALENLFQETKYPDVGTREQLARKVHLREEKVEVGARGVPSGKNWIAAGKAIGGSWGLQVAVQTCPRRPGERLESLEMQESGSPFCKIRRSAQVARQPRFTPRLPFGDW